MKTPAPQTGHQHFLQEQEPQRQAWLASAIVAATVLALIALGHDGRRVAQVAVLAAPVIAWLAWPLRSLRLCRLRAVIVWLWAMSFAVDGVIRAYLLDAYQAAPNGSLVVGAAANTNSREAGEYLQMHWRSIMLWAGVLLAAGLVVGRQVQRGRLEPAVTSTATALSARPSRWAVMVLSMLLLAASIGYLSKPWRRLHPIAFWAGWAQTVNATQAEWSNRLQARERTLEHARSLSPSVANAGPHTVFLVISDSINRDNMQLYGYPRATTPRLAAHKAQLGGDLVVLRNAWSVDASTLPALNKIFNFGAISSEQAPHLLALARAAGYKTWWISNHDDMAIEQQHARLADVVDIVNRAPGRAGASLDAEVLDCVQEAIDDKAGLKLVVVHLMGAHPHYSLRFPANANPFDDAPDTVGRSLASSGRSAWVRYLRDEYDAALLYHDFVISELLQMARNRRPANGPSTWMYLSDHGQEVGHTSDRAGHSPATPSGYRIPALIWRSQPHAPLDPLAAARPFRADWTAWTLTDLMGIAWAGQRDKRDVLHPAYDWQAPTMPFQVKSFTQ